jgi:hypothetical protein
MALEEVVERRGLKWRRYMRGFMELFEDRRYWGGGGGETATGTGLGEGDGERETEGEGGMVTPLDGSGSSSPSFPSTPSAEYLEGLIPNLPSTAALPPPYGVMTLWQSYKEGEAYVRSAGARDEVLIRAAFGRLVARLAIAMAYVADTAGSASTGISSRGNDGGCPAAGGGRDGADGHCRQLEVSKSDMVRYVTTFPMMCFGPLLALISSGDSRMLVVLFHVYRVVGALLPEEKYWWCKHRVEVMQEAIGRELRDRGLEVCLRRRSEVA